MSTAWKSTFAALVAVIMLGLAACSGGGDEEAAPAEGEADLRGIPDVVATVNDSEITKDDFVPAFQAQFQQSQMQAQTTGQPVDQDALKQQTAEGLVNNELLLQEAESRGFESTPEEVDEMLADFVEQSGAGSPEAYLETLAEQGLNEEQARGQLADQVTLEKLFADEGAGEEPTDEELREQYDAAVEQQESLPQAEGQEPPEIPPFEEVKEQLADQARSQQQNQVAQSLLEGLREEAEIDIAL